MAKKPPPPPHDAATIMRLKAELETGFTKDDAQIRDMRAVREQTDAVDTGSTRYTTIVVRDPTLTDEIARNVATLTLNPPKVTCTYAPSGTEPAEHNTTEREIFYTELLEDMATKIEGQNARTRSIDMNLGDGGVWAKVLYAKELWEECGAIRRRKPGEDAAAYTVDTEQAKRDGGQPFVMIAVDPLSFYPVRSGTKLVAGMEVQSRPLTQTLMHYGLTVGSNGEICPGALGQPQNKWDAQKLPTTVEYVEYWDEWRCYTILNGCGKNAYLIEPWLHEYGRPPYFPGMGFMMGHWANRKVGWGMAQSKRWLVQYSSFLNTVLADVAARDSYTPVVHEVGEQTAAALMGKDGKPEFTEDFHAELRDILRAYPGDKWYEFPVRDIAPALREAIVSNRAAIEATLTPKVTANIGGGMEGAGFAINTVLAEAKILHHPYVQNLEQMFKDILDFIDYVIVNKVKGAVWLYGPPQAETDNAPARKGGWISLSDADIKKYPVKKVVEIDPDRPTAKLIEGQYHALQTEKGFESLDQARLAQGRNPDAVRDGLTKDEIRQSDWYKAYRQKLVTEEMGFGHLFAMSQLALAVAQTGQLPGMTPPGVAPSPGGAPGSVQPGGIEGGAGQPPTPNMGALAGMPNQAQPDAMRVNTGQGALREEVPAQSAAAGVTSAR